MKTMLQVILDEELCDYCPLPDECKGVYMTPGGHSAGCEGRRCKEAYEAYIEESEEEDEWEYMKATT